MDIFVGTTGRVLDHIERGNIDFTYMRTMILDEADQMLKLGFKEDVEQVRSPQNILTYISIDIENHQEAMPAKHPDMFVFCNYPQMGEVCG